MNSKILEKVEKIELALEELHKSKDVTDAAYSTIRFAIRQAYSSIKFDCTICFDTGWYGGPGHDENPCPECSPLDHKRRKKYNYTVEYKDPMYGSNIKEKVFDSLDAIEHRLKKEGVGNYRIY